MPSQPTCWPAFASALATDSFPIPWRGAIEHFGSVLRLELPVELTLAVVKVDGSPLNPRMRQAVGAHVERVPFRQKPGGHLAFLNRPHFVVDAEDSGRVARQSLDGLLLGEAMRTGRAGVERQVS